MFAEAAGARTIARSYPAIQVALELLGDGHSWFRTREGAVLRAPTRTCSAPVVEGPQVPADIGYVRIPAFGGAGAEAIAFANDIQGEIEAADREDLVGWIVDLRGNTGGNMWPMLAGVGPVLGEGIVGYFFDPEGAETVWEYRDGASLDGGIVQGRVDTTYRLHQAWPRVAVLTDGRVASSGEAVAIAFRERRETRSFGTPTCGLSTGVRSFRMSDGATLGVTTVVMADRTRISYGDEVVPDEVVSDPDATVQRAIEWLRS